MIFFTFFTGEIFTFKNAYHVGKKMGEIILLPEILKIGLYNVFFLNPLRFIFPIGEKVFPAGV